MKAKRLIQTSLFFGFIFIIYICFLFYNQFKLIDMTFLQLLIGLLILLPSIVIHSILYRKYGRPILTRSIKIYQGLLTAIGVFLFHSMGNSLIQTSTLMTSFFILLILIIIFCSIKLSIHQLNYYKSIYNMDIHGGVSHDS